MSAVGVLAFYFDTQTGEGMKITFESGIPGSTHTEKNSESRERSGSAVRKSVAAYRTDITGNGNGMWETAVSRKNGRRHSMEELTREAGGMDTQVIQDYRIVMSHTMSEEDYARLDQSGFSMEQLDPSTVVTIVDKIKAELARSGQRIEGYTDDIDMDTLAAAVGSQGLARAIADSFSANDIPLTKENVERTLDAAAFARELDSPGEEQYRYMVDNEMDPDILSFYKAQSSVASREGATAPRGSGRGAYGGEAGGASTAGSAAHETVSRPTGGPGVGTGQETAGSVRQGPDYFADDVEGYYSRNAGAAGARLPEDQIEKALERAGFAVNDENKNKAAWLADQGLALTRENLLRYDALAGTDFPVEQEQAVRAAAAAIAQGKDAVYGNLSDTGNIYQKAADLTDRFLTMTVEQCREKYGSDMLGARRQLEEIRLRMTAEVNVKLLKSGFSIDTAPMEELIEALRQAEKQVANQYFPQQEDCVEKYECYTKVCTVAEELPQLPAELLGSYDAEDNTLLSFHAAGSVRREEYRRAGESYEALMTSPRPDMGDHIQKAFRNVDDILEEMNLECTRENRRAVRILGYNGMEITKEHIDRVIRADREVTAVVERMTPAASLRMIRDGVNPLEQSFEELNRYFDSLPASYEEQAESYSRFLYSLEQNKSITSEERSAYIGVFRLLHQVEKSDGAAVGMLVHSQAQLNFSNLLTAVRTGKTKHLDRRITEESGFLSRLAGKDNSISEQIEAGLAKASKENNYDMTQLSETETARNSRIRQEMEDLRQAAGADQECVRMLERGGIPVNGASLLAAQELRSRPAQFLSGISKRSGRRTVDTIGKHNDTRLTEASETETAQNIQNEDNDSLWTKLDQPEEFREEYLKWNEETLGSVESLTMEAEASIDVRELKLLHSQLAIAGGLGGKDEYYIPMKLGQEETLVHLCLEQRDGVRGQVNISVESEAAGRLEARFYLNDGHVSGYLAGNSQESVMKLQKAADIFTDNVSEEWKVDSLQITEGSIGETASPVSTAAADADLYHIAKLFLTALKDDE